MNTIKNQFHLTRAVSKKRRQYKKQIPCISVLLAAIICAALLAPCAQAQFLWATRVASTTTWANGPVAGMSLDTNENCYVTGQFDGTNDFGGRTLTNLSVGGSDIFVAKYNSSGVLQWAQRAGGSPPNGNFGRGAGVDSNGNVYVTGGVSGPADFGSFNLPASSSQVFFLAKYNNAGTVQWVQQGVGGQAVYGTQLAVDGTGNSYALAFAHNGDTITFGSTNVTTPNEFGGDFDTSTILLKYDNNGTVQWACVMGGYGETLANSVAVDAAGNVYVSGHFKFNANITIGTSNLVLSAGSSQNSFVAKFNNSGALTWVQQLEGSNVNNGGVAVDQAEDVYVTGSFQTNVNFGGISLTNAGSSDAFIAKYSSAGAIYWALQAGGSNGGLYSDVALDGQGNVYPAGDLSSDAAVAKYNPAGTLQWTYSAGGSPATPVASIVAKCAVDAAGNCYLAGWYQGTNTTFGTSVLQPQGAWNFFLTKLSPALVVTTTSLPNGTNGVAYSQALAASAGQTPYSWTISSGVLPPGLTLATNGVISGTPTANGPFNFTVKVTDATNSTATQPLTLTVVGPPSIVTIQPTSNPVTVTVGSNVTFTVSVAGTGPFSYQWQLNGTNLPSGVITTVAGNGWGAGTGYGGYSGDGGAATNAELNNPEGVAMDATGNLFIADQLNGRIRKVGTNGTITTVAGNGTNAYSGDGGAATNAELTFPSGVAVDATGNLFIADDNNCRIRKVGTNGIIITVAGNGTYGYSGDGDAATNARLWYPSGVAVDATGNLFIADSEDMRIRKVGTNGIINTVAGNGYGAGLFYGGYSGDGGAATNAELSEPSAVAVDAGGNLFIADEGNQRIREVGTNGIIITVAGNGTNGYSGDGGAATNAELSEPSGVAVDATGNLFIADTYNERIRKVVFNSSVLGPALVLNDVGFGNAGAYDVVVSGPYGSVTSSKIILNVTPPLQVTTAAMPSATNGSAYSRQLSAVYGQLPYSWSLLSGSLPPGLTLATNGVISGTPTNNGTFNFTVKVTDALSATATQLLTLTVGGPPSIVWIQPANNNSIVVTVGNNVSVAVSVAGTGPFSYQWQLNETNLPNRIITTVAGGGTNYPGDGGAATSAELIDPYGVAVDATGDLFIADFLDARVRKVDTNGIITTVAGGGTNYPGDGGAATSAELSGPSGVALDATGSLFIAGGNRVYKVDTNGIIATVAGGGTNYPGDGSAATNAALGPTGVAVDTFGNLFIADWSNSRIRKVDTSGIITTVAGGGTNYPGDGGAATNAALGPSGVAVDATGNLFIADPNDNRIRKVDANGIIATVAGNGAGAGTGGYGDYFSGDGGAATNAELNLPQGVAVDATGNLFIADWENQRIREVGTNGIINTVAGNGTNAYSGDWGAATNAALGDPQGVAVDATGNLFIADSGNGCIRKVGSGPTLVLNDVSGGNAGTYRVVVSGPYGSVTSSAVNLTVTLPPLLAPQITGKTNFTFLLSGPSGSNYVLQASTNLLNWSSVSTSTMPVSGTITMTNVIIGYNRRFYRVYLQ